jgi:hypothetical protein
MLEHADAHSQNDSLPHEGPSHHRCADDQSLQDGTVGQRAELPEGGHLADHQCERAGRFVAEKLIPTGHAYGTKRQPLDSNYYETFNKDNVLLVDAKDDGAIEQITEKGILAGALPRYGEARRSHCGHGEKYCPFFPVY